MVNRTRQAVSWISPYGSTTKNNLIGETKNNLIGQIFFPYDNATIDEQDKVVLDALVDHLIIALLGTRVKLRFEGHCDFRGSTAYNRRLAEHRARAVKSYFDEKLSRSSRFFSSSMVSFGEKHAGRTDLDKDRRVDILSSFVMKKPPIELPPTIITADAPKQLVSRPVEFLDIERYPLFTEDGPYNARPPWHVIVLEKHEMVDATFTFPYGRRLVASAVHSSLPLVKVYRYRIKWRKPRPSDTVNKISAALLNILAGGLQKAGGYEFGPGIPALKPPNVVYKSWAEFRVKDDAAEFQKYKGASF